jgi:hypothetical protein
VIGWFGKKPRLGLGFFPASDGVSLVGLEQWQRKKQEQKQNAVFRFA